MEFLLPTLKILSYTGIGLIVLGGLILFGVVRGSRSPLNYILGSIICIAIGIFFLTLKTTGSIMISEDSLELKAVLTNAQVIPLDEITQVKIIDDLESSEWRPVKKRSGTAAGEIRTGWFSLQNGRKAYLVLQGNKGIGFEAGREHVFLIGVPEFEELLSALRTKRPELF